MKIFITQPIFTIFLNKISKAIFIVIPASKKFKANTDFSKILKDLCSNQGAHPSQLPSPPPTFSQLVNALSVFLLREWNSNYRPQDIIKRLNLLWISHTLLQINPYVIISTPVKVLTAIRSSLNYSPSSSIRHVTVNGEYCWALERFDFVKSTALITIIKNLRTVCLQNKVM